MREQPEWERDNPGELYRRCGRPGTTTKLTDAQREMLEHMNVFELDFNRGIRYSVPLGCGHTAIYPSPPPSVKDIIYCRKCSDYQTVTGRSREVLGR